MWVRSRMSPRRLLPIPLTYDPAVQGRRGTRRLRARAEPARRSSPPPRPAQTARSVDPPAFVHGRGERRLDERNFERLVEMQAGCDRQRETAYNCNVVPAGCNIRANREALS